MKKIDRKSGRPQKDIQPEMVEKLASIGCTGDEIATVLGCCQILCMLGFPTALKRDKTKQKLH